MAWIDSRLSWTASQTLSLTHTHTHTHTHRWTDRQADKEDRMICPDWHSCLTLGFTLILGCLYFELTLFVWHTCMFVFEYVLMHRNTVHAGFHLHMPTHSWGCGFMAVWGYEIWQTSPWWRHFFLRGYPRITVDRLFINICGVKRVSLCLMDGIQLLITFRTKCVCVCVSVCVCDWEGERGQTSIEEACLFDIILPGEPTNCCAHQPDIPK